MRLNQTTTNWDGDNRNGINENWNIIEGMADSLSDEITDEVMDRIKGYANTAIVNEVRNGNFSEGNDGLFAWFAFGGTKISNRNGTLIAEGTGAHPQVRVRQADGYGLAKMPYRPGHKLFFKGNFKVTNTDATRVGFAFWGSDRVGRVDEIMESHPKKDVNYVVSDIVELSENGSGNMIVQLRTQYPTSVIQSGKITEMQNILVIDLTDTFGKGNEPSVDEMNYLLSFYENGWFESAGAGKTALASFRLTNDMISDLRDVESDVENLKEKIGTSDIEIKNEVRNGNFKDGTFAWSGITGTRISANSKTLTATGTGDHQQVRVRQADGYGIANVPYRPNHKIYVKADLEVDNSDASKFGFVIFGSQDVGRVDEIDFLNPAKDTAHKVSGMLELSENGSGNILMQIRTQYASASIANGKSTKIRNVHFIDLTEIFGAGNEPTKDIMDRLIDRYPNGYFDGNPDIITQVNTNLQMALSGGGNADGHTEVDIVNGVKNGNFDSADAWSPLSGSDISVNDNTLHVVGNGNNVMVRAYQITNLPYKLGHKIYVRGIFELDNDDCKKAGLYLQSSAGYANHTFFQKTAPKKDEPFVMSGIMDLWDDKGRDNVSVYVRADYSNASDADGKTIKAQKIMAIDLTDTFGKGNEPADREYIDELINRYPDKFFDVKPQSDKWQLAHTNFSLSVTKEPKMPMIVFGIDDGNLTDYTTAYPLFKSKGIRGSSYLVNKWVGSNDDRWLNEAQIQEMYEDKDESGRRWWDFQCHTANHNHFTDYTTDEEIRNEFIINNQLFERLGLPYPDHHVYPFGNYDQRVINIGLQYRKTLRATGMTSGLDYNEYDRANFGALNARSIDITEEEIDRINAIKKAIDDNVKNRGVLILYMHQIKEVIDGEYQAQLSVVEEIIDYALSYINRGQLKSVTHKEACDALIAYQQRSSLF